MQKIEKRSYLRLTEGRAKSYSFIALPSDIIYGGKFKISPAAKILYAAMLGRASLSERSATERSAFVDKDGYIYIYFTNAEVCEILDCGKNTATKFIKELLDSGLIERKAQGLGKAVRYYVMDFSDYAGADEKAGIEPVDVPSEPDEPEELPTEPDKPEELVAETAENSRSQKMGIWTPKDRDTPSPLPKNGSLESQKMGVKTPSVVGTNKIKENKIEFSQNQSIPPNLPLEEEGRTEGQNLYSLFSEKELREGICQQIDYDYLIANGTAPDLLDCIVSVMAEALREGKPVKTRNKEYPFRFIRWQLEALDHTHIEFIANNLHKANAVKNPRKYLLTMLLNAAIDSEFHTEVEVQKDFYENFGKWEEQAHSGRDWSEVNRQASLKSSPELPGSKNDLDDFLAELG